MKKIALFAFVLTLLVSLAGVAAAAEKGFTGKDHSFLKDAAAGGLMEVQLGQMAQQKAQSKEVKDFAARMVTDHGKANDELMQIAKKKNAAMPAELTSKHKSVVDKLSKASGADFDKQYMREMVKDHAKDVTKFKNSGKKVKDPDLKAWAGKTLPVLEEHLKLARDLAQKQGVDSGKTAQEEQQQTGKNR